MDLTDRSIGLPSGLKAVIYSASESFSTAYTTPLSATLTRDIGSTVSLAPVSVVPSKI